MKQWAIVADPVAPEKVFFVAEEQGVDLMLVLITRYYWFVSLISLLIDEILNLVITYY
jgi:hypothetical protein